MKAYAPISRTLVGSVPETPVPTENSEECWIKCEDGTNTSQSLQDVKNDRNGSKEGGRNTETQGQGSDPGSQAVLVPKDPNFK